MTSPRAPTDLIIRRPRLESLLDQAGTRRLTALTGGAGSGKTTLLAQWAAGRPVAWQTMTSGDDTLSVLARGIVEKLRLQVPDLGPDLFLAIEGGLGPETDRGEVDRADSLAAELSRELEAKLRRDLFLVLDDLHSLNREGAGSRFVAALCRNAPPRLHMITASRESLPFPTSRLRVQGEAAEIRADQLAFTVDEVGELLALATGTSDPAAAEAVFDRTAGWPVAVVLATRLGPDDGATATAEESALFDYLAEEVIGSESGEILDALAVASLLPWMTAELAERVGVPPSATRLFDPKRRSIYMAPAPNQHHAVTVSPLLRSYLMGNHGLGETRRRSVLEAAARAYEESAALAEAIECLIDLDDPSRLSRFVSDHGERLLAGGLARRMLEAIERIPVEQRGPDVLLVEGEARQVLGDWEGATRCYQALVGDDAEMPARLAWRLGFLSHMRGDVKEALDVYRRGRRDGSDLANEAALLGWTASAHWLRGERDEAQRLAEEALALAHRADDSRALATAHTVLAMVAALDGDRAGNDIHYLRALEHAERARDVVQTIRIRSNRGSHFLEEGDFVNALAELGIALRLADMTGFQLWRAMSVSNRAQVLAGLGRLEESVAELEQSRELFRQMGSSLESYPLAQLGDVYLLRGDTALARAAYEEAIRMGEEAEDLQALVPALSGLARVIAAEDPETAEELADRAAEVESVIGHVRALLAQGFVALAAGSDGSALAKARAAAEVARSRHDLPGLAEALELEAAVQTDPARAEELLGQARRIWEEVQAPVGMARVDMALGALPGRDRQPAARAAITLRQLGAKGLAMEAERIAGHAARSADVAIRTLGGFGVVVAGESVPASAWQSKVARDVVGMLAAARGRPIHREVIIDRLWRGEEPARAANRLSVALSTIRSVFDPVRAHPADHYLDAGREAISLDLRHVELDVESFFDEAGRGRSALRSGDRVLGLSLLRSAETRYLGEFLEDQPYADWAVGVREEARSEFISIARILADVDRANGEHEAAARWYMRILEQDPYDEPTHLSLVSAMSAAGHHGSARRLYRIYVSRMAELEVEPAPFPSSRHLP